MLVNSFLVQGSGLALAAPLTSVATSKTIDALALFSLGADHPTLVNAVQQSGVRCPVYLAESYGIIGHDDAVGRNVELMEKGRGQEYGYRGGSGGRGCLAVAYSDGAIVGHTDEFPTDASSLMVVADTSGKFLEVAQEAPLHYGGIAKQAWRMSVNDGKLEDVPYFWVASRAGSKQPVGVSAFTGEALEATDDLLAKLPSGLELTGDVGLFPCYTRGVNHYGEENVESDAISAAITKGGRPAPRIYGMFAHGELGPLGFSGFVDEQGKCIPCKKHSKTSILSIHTKNAAESLN